MRKSRAYAIIAIVFFAFSLSACASMTGRTAGEIVDDSVITTAINGKIIQDPDLSYLKVNVNSTNGNVVLTGFVPNREAEERLIGIARDTRGVKSVESELKIQQ
jgi:hyperosmotically inducible periplasmic protein